MNLHHAWPSGLVLAFLSFGACVGPSPSQLSHAESYLVVVNSVRLPDYMDWYTRFAEHSWVDIKQGDENSWTRIEVDGPESGVQVFTIESKEARAQYRWDNRVAVLETLSGTHARVAIPHLLKLAAAESDYGQSPRGRIYHAFPGPNSNTFIAYLLENTPNLHAELHHNAVGKDYPHGFRIGITSSGYGLEVDGAFLGLGLGLRQGLELHLAQLTWGLSLWPPAVKIPFLPRIGIHQGWVGAGYGLERGSP